MAKILIVEDYPSIQTAYQTALVAEGHQVSLATDGAIALELTKKQSPDIILLDLLMANMGGLEFLRAYQPKAHPQTQIIVFSNLSSPELAKEATDLGASKYLLKSKFTPKAIAELIKQML